MQHIKNISVGQKVLFAASVLAISFAFVFALSAQAAGPWFVSATAGNDANSCTSAGSPCLTIQAAINKASPGDTINVAAGVYAEHVTVNKAGLTLSGANNAVACRASRSTESVITGTTTGAVAITADNVTLNGFQISAASNALGSGIWTPLGGAVKGYLIKNNLISQSQIGLYPNSSGTSTVSCNIFDGNNQPGSAGGAGIYSEGTESLTIDNNEFKNHNTNNPVIFAATGADAHKNLAFSNNLIHDNNNGGSAVYALALNNASFTGNDITADTKDLYFDDGNHGVMLTNNTLHSTIGIYVHDGGYTGIGGLNTGIVANRNSLTGHSAFGIQNDGGQTANVDGTCNWWGAANGPSGAGPGTGDAVSTGVTFAPWLTTSNLATTSPCNGMPPQNVTVTIHKYIDGAHATSGNANSQSFPMASCWSATNIGTGCGAFSLAPATYAATTSSMTNGANYSTNEDTSGQVVGPNCANNQAFALVGYSTGDTEAQAAAAPVSTTSPALTNITTNKHIIVWNKDCKPKLTVTKIVINDNGGTGTTSNFALFIDNATTTSGVASTTTVGGHLVSEGSHAGYLSTIGGACDANGNVTLAAGDNKTCTITNNDIATTTATTTKVTIVKYVSGAHATASSSMGVSFPMQSSWNAANLGGAGSGTYPLGPAGFNTPNAYEAVTSNMDAGSSYATNENTGTSVVGPNCANNQQFRLAGYSTGATLAQAASSTVASSSPSFTNLQSDKWVIVWNIPCAATTTPPNNTPPPPANACSLTQAPSGYTLVNGSGGSDTITLAPGSMFVGHGGNDTVNGGDGNYIICTGGGNDTIHIGNGDYTIDAGGGNNTITTGNGAGPITTGSGNDTITTGNGAHTINAGGGNNTITTGGGAQTVTTGTGNDKVTTGSGADTINVGSGNNNVSAGAGADTITAGSGNDIVDGGADTDSCSAGGGSNTITNCP